MSQNSTQLPIKLIAIDGHGGSGKSTLASLLAQRYKAEIIHIDDFTGWHSNDEWWQKIVSFVFEPIIQGKTHLHYARAKWWELHNPEPVTDQLVTNPLIFEGVGASRKELRDYAALRIFVDIPEEICLQRGFERDRGLDGKADNEILELWQGWIEDDKKYFQKHQPQSVADFIVSGQKTINETLLRTFDAFLHKN